MTTHIFCDECGSTGNNLLDPSQPFFAYATVAISPDEAAEVVAKLVKDHRPQGDELKGRNLVASSRGRRLVGDLLRTCGERSVVSLWHKRFALATQFFEHVIEPVLAKQNSIFYRIGFHKFISNLLYIDFAASTADAVKTLESFQRLVKARGAEPFEALFPSSTSVIARSAVLADIEAFVMCHLDVISQSIDTRDHPDPLYRWSLDASLSAFWAVLLEWDSRTGGDPMVVVCDELKPLYEVRHRFDIMIGRTDRPKVWYPTGPRSPVFNLKGPVSFGRSHDHPGIQLADVVAAASVHALMNRSEKHSQAWLEALQTGLMPIFPEPDLIDLRTRSGAVNAVVLTELVSRSLQKRDLFDGMLEFIEAAEESFPSYAARLPADE